MLDRRATSALVGHRRIELRMPKAQVLRTRSVTRLGMTRRLGMTQRLGMTRIGRRGVTRTPDLTVRNRALLSG